MPVWGGGGNNPAEMFLQVRLISEGFFSFPATHLNDLECFTENNRKGENIPNWVILLLLAKKADRQSGRRGPWSSKDLHLYPSSPADL